MPLMIVKGRLDDWGLIPTFLDDDDPRTVREQFNAHYISGWSPFKGHTLDDVTYELRYPGDPPLWPLSIMLFRNEVIVLYPYEWVLVRQWDSSWEICRMD